MRRRIPVILLFIVAASALAQGPMRDPARLIADLDHPRSKEREAAYEELVRLGDKAVPALRQALVNPASPGQRDRITTLLAMRKPSEFDADFNGWQMIYGTYCCAQTFEATGASIKSLRLRVAQISATRPPGVLDVEIRDVKFETIYARGTIDPAVLERDFKWQGVALKQLAPLKIDESYAFLFSSRNSNRVGPWVVNVIYKDIYPHGYYYSHKHQDTFFHLEFQEGSRIRVGPASDDVKMKTPINSGAVGGNEPPAGPLQLQNFGAIPVGKVAGEK